MARTLFVTNDFPTRQGGIEAFIAALCQRMPPEEVVVYTASMEGDRDYDATLAFPVHRDPTRMLVPSPPVRQRVRAVLEAERCDRVVFGAAAPLGLLAPSLRAAGAERLVGITHGHETWWARVPGARRMLYRIGEGTDVLTYLGSYTRDVIAGALSASAAQRMRQLTPGVDVETFQPGIGGARLREQLGIEADTPVVSCIARLTARKGQDTLIEAWPRVLQRVPEAVLLLVGGGADQGRLERLAAEHGVGHQVVFAGAVPWRDVAPYFDVGDVFAMPCRTRLGGLEPEALGIVFLEAQACGRPVVVGDSGGAPDAVRHGETGYVVDPYNSAAVAAKLVELLENPEHAQAMGAAGRAWVSADWTWDASVARLRELLGYADIAAP